MVVLDDFRKLKDPEIVIEEKKPPRLSQVVEDSEGEENGSFMNIFEYLEMTAVPSEKPEKQEKL